MWIGETIDLDDHDLVVDFMKNQSERIKKLENENEQLKQQVECLEFKLRTIEAYDRTANDEYSDSVYDFKKKLKKW